jgi:hypothetical protein
MYPPSQGAYGYQTAQGYPGYQGYPPAGTVVGGYHQYVAPPGNNGMAVASLVLSCAGIIPFAFGIPCVLGIIFGFVARSQIRQSQGRQGGAGLALAGIIVGFALIGIFILVVSLVAAFGHTSSCIGSSQFCGN